jgi:hypothetical protein
VNSLHNELFSFLEEFSCKDSDSSGSITNFVILCLGDVDKNLGCWIVDPD